MYLHTEDEAAMLRHSKLLTEDDMANEKNTKISVMVKGQGQMSPTSNHFQRSPQDIFLPSYINF